MSITAIIKSVNSGETMVKYFFSMKTALLLMTAIVAVSVFASFESNTQIYDSYLFKGLLVFLIINLAVCTIIRTSRLLAKLQNKSFVEIKKAFSNVPKLQTADMHPLREKIANTFHQKGYRIIHLQGNHESIICLNKGIFSLIANQVIHYALIIIFIGALVSSFGFTGEVSGGIGQVAELPKKMTRNNLKIRIDDFNTLYNSDRTVKNWETKLTIIDGETKITQGRTYVNHPFRYQDITIYQSGYQYTYLVELNNNGAKTRHFLPSNKMIPLSGRFFFIKKNERQKYFMTVCEGHTIIETYALNKGTIVDFPNHTALKFIGEVVLSILKVKNDPGIPIIMAGLTMLAIGFILLYLGPYREIMVLFDECNRTVQISIICKSRILKESLTNEALDLVLGG